jgi:NADPH2:quinone reductase
MPAARTKLAPPPKSTPKAEAPVQKRVWRTGAGHASLGLKIEEGPIPEPARGEVRIRISAARIEAAEACGSSRRGYFGRKAPVVPGGEVVGVVDQVGPETPDFLLGRKVAALVKCGAYARYLCLPEAMAVRMPKRVRDDQALGVVAHYLPAFQLLHRVAELEEGDRVLIHQADTGVGRALVALALRLELEVYATFPKGFRHLPWQKQIVAMDLESADFAKRVLRDHPKGVHAFFDLSGGGLLASSLSLLRKDGGGFLMADRSTHGEGGLFFWMNVWRTFFFHMTRGRHVELFSVHRYARVHPERYQKDLHRLLHKVKAGKIHPPALRTVALDHLEEASRAFDAGETILIAP